MTEKVLYARGRPTIRLSRCRAPAQSLGHAPLETSTVGRRPNSVPALLSDVILFLSVMPYYFSVSSRSLCDVTVFCDVTPDVT